jgi:type IV secretory pathway VirB2 component (pilin)
MEGEMIVAGMIYYLCSFMAVLVSVVVGGAFIAKRLSPSSWFRNIFAMIAGIGASLISLLIVYAIGWFLSFNNSYFLRDSSMTDEMAARKQSELAFNLSLISASVFVSVVLVSMLGGYLAGKVARQNELVYGFFIGLGLLVLSVRFGDSYFIGRHIDNLDLVFIQAARFGATVVGSYFALYQRERNQANLTANSEA